MKIFNGTFINDSFLLHETKSVILYKDEEFQNVSNISIPSKIMIWAQHRNTNRQALLESDNNHSHNATGGNMCVSKIQGRHYFISWDNPFPANSSSMLKALGILGKITELQTKTSRVLSPRASTKWRDVRQAIKRNLHPKKGNAFYVNLRSGKGFKFGSQTKFKWKKVP